LLDKFLEKIADYKKRMYDSYSSFYSSYHNKTKDILDKTRKRVEIEKIRLEIKRNYYKLGKYVAKQNILSGYSDFSMDDKFNELTANIKKTSEVYNEMKKKH
tara:strand:- start:1012 stop:1317 length:306 start_codon:yes stop_codon:yes gene_type:complete